MIKCLICGKKYNYKNNHEQEVFICSGKKNYGTKFCNNVDIKQNDLLYVIEKHYKLYDKKFEIELTEEGIRELIDKIEVEEGNIVKIYYKDGESSEYNSNTIIY
jgi:hypothetical protein